MNIQNYFNSKYSKKKHLYFHTQAKYKRNPDTIIIWYALTPTGRISKWWANLRFNAERNISKENKIKEIENYQFPKVPKGYTWSEPLLYSGNL